MNKYAVYIGCMYNHDITEKIVDANDPAEAIILAEEDGIIPQELKDIRNDLGAVTEYYTKRGTIIKCVSVI